MRFHSLVKVKAKSNKPIFDKFMMTPQMASYLRSHRRQSALTLSEVARVLGMVNDIQVSRHERARAHPTFLMALAYEALFQVPVARLFPEPSQSVSRNVEAQLALLRAELESSTAQGRTAALTARKLEWITLRRPADVA